MNDKKIKIFTFSWKDTLLSLTLIMIPFGLCYLIQIYIEDSAVYSSLLFLFSVFLISRFTNGYLYGILSSIIASFIVNYAFTIPYFELSFSIPAYILTFFVMLAIALLTSVLTTRIMEEESIKIEAEKERMRGNFLQSVSHDLRTPLTSILGNSTNLAKNEKLSENDFNKICLSDIAQKWFLDTDFCDEFAEFMHKVNKNPCKLSLDVVNIILTIWIVTPK